MQHIIYSASNKGLLECDFFEGCFLYDMKKAPAEAGAFWKVFIIFSCNRVQCCLF